MTQEEIHKFVEATINAVNDVESKILMRKGINRLSRERGGNPCGTAETMSQYLYRYIKGIKA